MELRDAVEILVGLADDLKAIINEMNRAVDGLQRALLPPERFGVSRDALHDLRERVSQGVHELTLLQAISETVRDRLIEDARADASAGSGEALAKRLSEGLERARAAFEHSGRLKHLLARRSETEGQIHAARRLIEHDEETQELLGLVLAARQAAAERSSQDARRFVVDAEEVAAHDGNLAGISAVVRALRDSLRTSQDASAIGADLVRRAVDCSLRLSQEREDLRRRLAQLGRDAERRQEITHGLFQAVTKASEVLDLAAQLARTLETERRLSDGALGPLRAACLEHGIVSLLLELRGARMERDALEAAISDLSAAIGDLLSKLGDRPDAVEDLARVWDVLADLEATAIEAGWERTYCAVLGVEVEGGGVLRIPRENLERLAAADSLDPWNQEILQKLESISASIAKKLKKLVRTDSILATLVAEGGVTAEAARLARQRLGAFRSEARRASERYWAELGRRLLSPEGGFSRVALHLAAFHEFSELPATATEDEKRNAKAQTLATVRETFARLEASAAFSGDEVVVDWKKEEEDARNATLGAQRSLATVLARIKRLRSVLLPPPTASCERAIELAASLRKEPLQPGEDPAILRDQLGDALEALHLEKLQLEHLNLPAGSEVRTLATLSRERSRRLLDLYGASLTLLFRLLELLGAEHDASPDEVERGSYLSWMQELLLFGSEEMRRHVDRLEDCLFDLEDNAERLARWCLAFDAYHRWAQPLADTDVGAELILHRREPLFDSFENSLSLLGSRTLDELDIATADWKQTSELESLIDLHAAVLTHLVGRSTATDMRNQYEALRARAASLRDRLMERVAAEDEQTGPTGLF